MNYFLVKFTADYADEFDVTGFRIYSETSWKEEQEAIQKYFEAQDSFTFHFGSNEEIEFEDEESFQRCLNVKKLTQKEAQILKRCLELDSLNIYGMFPALEY